jgi:hypothetical protein
MQNDEELVRANGSAFCTNGGGYSLVKMTNLESGQKTGLALFLG